MLGSKVTIADAFSRLTCTTFTPRTRCIAFRTTIGQVAQVIFSTEYVTVSVFSDANAGPLARNIDKIANRMVLMITSLIEKRRPVIGRKRRSDQRRSPPQHRFYNLPGHGSCTGGVARPGRRTVYAPEPVPEKSHRQGREYRLIGLESGQLAAPTMLPVAAIASPCSVFDVVLSVTRADTR